jgi:hypothetical protein
MSYKQIIVIIGFGLAVMFLAAVSSCTSKAEEPPKKKFSHKDVQGEFRSKQFTIDEHEHITVFDVPDRYEPHRCWVWTSDKTNTSHMKCDDDPQSSIPDNMGTLDN